ncbi:hypothetical protein [Allonocardiopsis opalescens]|uniref:Uncharacterized protein n=1 Tax=Allonocardiopsis opalescens TaxID=1144618 RepID=A0A2T0PUG2_9ACTN|nr:hypothetical protein [Allonocardiopsis opalescens]PRX92530.1 hypothetical protein CLV72_110292 [Allonocardiopsis opalescens]
MSELSNLPYLASAALGHAPLAIVYVVGVIVAIATWSRHPRRSGLAAGGLALLLVIQIATFLWQLYLPALYAHLQDAAGLGTWVTVFSLATALLSVVAWVLVLMALFARERGGSAAGGPNPPQDVPGNPYHRPPAV